MFEFDKFDRHRLEGACATPAAPYEPATGIEKISFLVWGEHCIECAAPSCFAMCDLYDRRSDGLCRRFRYGTYRNAAFRSFRGYGAEIRFKKWAKLEARGNAALEPVERVRRREKLLAWSSHAMNAVGKIGSFLTRRQAWAHLTRSVLDRYVRRLHRRSQSHHEIDAFLVEIYNPGPATARVQLLMQVARSECPEGTDFTSLPTPFVTTLALPPGYSRHEFTSLRFQALLDSGLPFDIAFVPEADDTARLVFLTADFVAYRSHARTGKPDIKCIVWDLDHTVWDGILLEEDDVAVRPHVRDLLATLDERGILHSVASKNAHDHAFAKLEELGIAKYFLYPQINWMPKSRNIARIAQRLNIGLDTLAFVDDNPFELGQVAQALPMVTCIRAEDVALLPEHPRFRGSGSSDARNRRRHYRDAMVREERQMEFGEDLLGFLASCGIEADIRDYEPKDEERISELVQRTNQLNFSGNKYSREQLRGILDDRTLEKHVIDVRDRYGSYGTVGFGLARRDGETIRVDDFMLSCRVQGKLIEQAFFHYLVQSHRGPAPRRLSVRYRRTDRNTPAWHVLHSLRFEPRDDGTVALDLDAHPLEPGLAQVNVAAFPRSGGA